jgi:hypothetical protein
MKPQEEKMAETKTMVAIELPEDEMVAEMIRAFFEGVPEDAPAEEIIANTHPHFITCARHAVRGLMQLWAAKIRQAGLGEVNAEKAVGAAGLASAGKPEATS